jgi:hypothetical protein
MEHLCSIRLVGKYNMKTYIHSFIENGDIYYFDCDILPYADGSDMFYVKSNISDFLKNDTITIVYTGDKKIFPYIENILYECEYMDDSYKIICDVLMCRILDKI